jgi:DNA-binding MarR family transcriptional regulator
VERRADPSDRRVRRLYLTETARPLMDGQFQELAAATREAALGGLSEAERAQLTELLMKVRNNLSGRDLGASVTGSEPTERPRANQKVSQNA